MTRVNCVPVDELTNPHLIAEYRELPRIFGLVRGAIMRREKPTDRRNPLAYTLGTGHCRFFYPRCYWLKKRQLALIAEMRVRGYAVNFDDVDHAAMHITPAWLNDWTPDEAALTLNRLRIHTRLRAMGMMP